jgi:hypothetical protein
MIAWYPSRYIGLVYRDMLVTCIDNINRSISRYYVNDPTRLCEIPCGFSADSIIACSARAHLKRVIPDAKRNQVLSCWFVRETHGQATSQRDLRIASCHCSARPASYFATACSIWPLPPQPLNPCIRRRIFFIDLTTFQTM